MEDSEFINQISERLFGYREASNDEIRGRIELLLENERQYKISKTAKVKVETLRRIARELVELTEA